MGSETSCARGRGGYCPRVSPEPRVVPTGSISIHARMLIATTVRPISCTTISHHGFRRVSRYTFIKRLLVSSPATTTGFEPAISALTGQGSKPD